MAIIQRISIRHKSGGQRKVIELLREGRKFSPDGPPVRYLAASIGPPWQTFQFELEFPDLAAYEAYWTAVRSHEGFPEYMERWRVAVESVQTEIWQIIDLSG